MCEHIADLEAKISELQTRVDVVERQNLTLFVDWNTERDRAARLEAALEKAYVDHHNWSRRTCSTCRKASELLGRPVGCVKFKAILDAARNQQQEARQ